MIRKALRFGKGYVCIYICGFSTERFLNACRYHGIQIWDLKPCKNGYSMYISLKDFRKLKPVCRKTRTRMSIIQKKGLPFFLFHFGRRKPFICGILLGIFLLFLLSQRIWSIELYGNSKYTDEMVMKFLSSENIQTGMSRSEVNCNAIVNSLRKQYADIVWASASVDGSLLTIRMKENDGSAEKRSQEEQNSPMDLIAGTDAVITKMITRKGVPLVSEGADVKKGDMLVSGLIPVFNDQKEIISYQTVKSDADIIGEKIIFYKDEISCYYIEKLYQDWKYTETHLTIGNIRFTLGILPEKTKQYTIFGKESQWTVADNLSFPVWYGFRSGVCYKSVRKKYSKTEIQKILSTNFKDYCSDLEKKGVEIMENNVKIYTGSENASAKGQLTIQMPMGILNVSTLPEEERHESGDM